MDVDLPVAPYPRPNSPETGSIPTKEVRSGRIGVSIVFWVCGCAFATWVSRIALFKHQLHLTDAQLGIALFAFGAGSLVGFPIAGFASPRFGSKLVSLALGIAYSLTLAAIPFATSLGSLSAILAVFGAFIGAMDVAMNDNGVRVENRYGRSIMSSLHGMFSLGGLCGGAVGLLATRLDISPVVHFAVGSVVFTAAMICAGVLLLHVAPSGHLDHPIFALPTKPLFAIGIVVACAFLCEGAMGDWSAIYLRDSLRTTPGFAVAGFVAFSSMMTLSRFVGDRVLNRWGPLVVMRVAGSIACFGLAVALVVGQPYAALFGFGCVGLGMSTIVPIGFSAAGRTPGMSSGSAIAAVATMGYASFLIGPPFIGFLATQTSLRLALGLVAVLSAVIVGMAGLVDSG